MVFETTPEQVIFQELKGDMVNRKLAKLTLPDKNSNVRNMTPSPAECHSASSIRSLLSLLDCGTESASSKYLDVKESVERKTSLPEPSKVNYYNSEEHKSEKSFKIEAVRRNSVPSKNLVAESLYNSPVLDSYFQP